MSDAGERRFVTILFSDLSGFTTLSERMDPEDVRDMVDALFKKFRAIIEAQGGTIDKFIGDAVMAVFGAPVAHEDDPLRAVRAGLAMQRALAGHNAEHGLALRLRVGINAGEVLWGSVGGDRATATGDAVNVAQRLESAAGPGAVLVSRAVARAAGRGVRFVELAPVALKGRKEAVAVFEAVEGEATSRASRGGVFAGRDEEMGALLEAWERGSGTWLVVEGETGVGKTRLAAEFARRAAERRPGAFVGMGRAVEGAPWPLAPLAEILRVGAGSEDPGELSRWIAEVLDEPDKVRRENVAHLVALSIGASPPGSPVLHLEPAKAAEEARFAWLAWLRAKSARGPVLLAIDDLQWADGGTVALLDFLAGRLEGADVLLLAAARPGGARPARFRRLELRELPETPALELAAACLGAPIEPALARFLMRSTGGNPCYMEEMAAFLREEGLVGGEPVSLLVEPDRVPHGLQGLLTARIDALDPEAREALKGASVVGTTFWQAFLGRVLERAVDGAVRTLRSRELVHARETSLLAGDEELVFRHALLRGAAYALLTKRDRTRLHGVVARLLEERIGEGGRRVRELAAHHREAAGDPAAAAGHWVLAASEALDAYQLEESFACCERAARAGREAEAWTVAARVLTHQGLAREARETASRAVAAAGTDGARLREARMAQARVEIRFGGYADCLRTCDDLARESPGSLDAAEVLTVRASALGFLGRFREATESAQQALDRLDDSPRARRLRADANFLMASALHRQGRNDLAAAAHERAYAHWRETGDLHGQAKVLTGLAILDIARGDFEAGERRAGASREISHRIGDRAAEGGARANLAIIYTHRGELDRARAEYEACEEIFRAAEHRSFLTAALNNLGQIHRMQGRVEEAVNLHEQALAIRRSIGDRSGEASALVSLGQDFAAKGDFARGKLLMNEGLAIFRELGEPRRVAGALNERAKLSELLGELEEAVRLATEAAEVSRGLGDRADEAVHLAQAARLRLPLGEPDAASALLARAFECHRATGHLPALAAALAVQGSLDLQAGRLDPAIATLREELDVRRTLRINLDEASARQRLGDALVARGDHAEAREMYDAALAIFRRAGDRLGQAGALDAIGALERALGAYARAEQSHEHALGLARETGISRAEAASLCRLGEARSSRGDLNAALESFDASIALLRRLSLPGALAECLDSRGRALAKRGDLDPALADFEEAISLRRRTGERREIAALLCGISNVRLRRCEPAVALEAAEESLRIRAEIGDRLGMGASLTTVANVHLDRGDFESAAALYGDALEANRAVGSRPGAATALNNIGWLHFLRGDASRAIDFLSQALTLRRELEDRHGAAWILSNLARARAAAGDLDGALRDFGEALPVFRELGERLNAGGTLAGMAECRLKKGDAAGALEAATEAEEILRDLGWKEGLDGARATIEAARRSR